MPSTFLFSNTWSACPTYKVYDRSNNRQYLGEVRQVAPRKWTYCLPYAPADWRGTWSTRYAAALNLWNDFTILQKKVSALRLAPERIMESAAADLEARVAQMQAELEAIGYPSLYVTGGRFKDAIEALRTLARDPETAATGALIKTYREMEAAS